MDKTTKDMDGKTLKIGDWVGFKSDIEQYGQIVEIKKGSFGGCDWLVLENENGFIGEYIGGHTRTRHPADGCWSE